MKIASETWLAFALIATVAAMAAYSLVASASKTDRRQTIERSPVFKSYFKNNNLACPAFSLRNPTLGTFSYQENFCVERSQPAYEKSVPEISKKKS